MGIPGSFRSSFFNRNRGCHKSRLARRPGQFPKVENRFPCEVPGDRKRFFPQCNPKRLGYSESQRGTLFMRVWPHVGIMFEGRSNLPHSLQKFRADRTLGSRGAANNRSRQRPRGIGIGEISLVFLDEAGYNLITSNEGRLWQNGNGALVL